MRNKAQTTEVESAGEEQHRKAWLQHALQTPQPYPRVEKKKQGLAGKILSFLATLK